MVRSTLAVLTLAVAVTGTGTSAATARSYVLVFSGSGTTTPRSTSFTTDLLLAVGATDFLVATGCTFTGSGPMTNSQGTLGSCFGASISGIVTLTSTLTVGSFDGRVTINGIDGQLATECVIEPTSINPTTSFALTCAGSWNIVLQTR